MTADRYTSRVGEDPSWRGESTEGGDKFTAAVTIVGGIEF